MNLRIIIPISFLLMLSVALVNAHERDFTEAQQLVNNSVPCSELTEEQLEAIGDYYMEQLHPGSRHEIMDEMMGGEGSGTLQSAHIQMAKVLYCKDRNVTLTYAGMMGMMPTLYDIGRPQQSNWMYSMMGFNNSPTTTDWLVIVLLLAGIILVVLLIAKTLSEMRRKNK